MNIKVFAKRHFENAKYVLEENIYVYKHIYVSVYFPVKDLITLNLHKESESKVAWSCPTLCDPMNCSVPGLPVHHQLPEFTQTHVH